VKRIALVTGGNRGIGFEICRQLGQRGLHVILTSRDADKGHKAAEKLRGEGLDVSYHPLDVTDPASVEAARDHVQREHGRLDVLVNNAGVYLDEGVSVFNVSPEVVRHTLEVNTVGPFLTCRAFVPMMRRSGYGRVVNVSSGAGDINTMKGRTAAYRMSKAALNALTRIVASEVSGHNVKVNAVGPGWVRTEMGGRGAPRSVEEGADTAVWLATLPDDGPTDGYFYDREQVEW
jgi:NAD(P)-dependent dehydrogenase (short-subunit alcohol dehydrogenase family)